MKTNLKKILLVLTVGAMLLGLVACGGGHEGKYYIEEMFGMDVAAIASMSGMSEKEVRESMYIELKSGGKFAMVSVDGDDKDSDEVTYTISGEKITLTMDGESVEGTIKGGVITIDQDGFTMKFKK